MDAARAGWERTSSPAPRRSTDGDGRVTLFELYTFAYRKTLLDSGVALTAQRASLSVDLRGAGELVLSQPARAASTLQLRGAADSRYVVFSLPSGAVMGEVSDGALSLPAGQFLIQQQSGSRRAVARVDLSWGGTRRLSERDFVAVSREELVARGGVRGAATEPPRGTRRAGALARRGGAGRAARGRVVRQARRAAGAGGGAHYLRGGAAVTGLAGGFQVGEPGPGRRRADRLSRGALSARAGLEGRYSFTQLERPDADRLRAAGIDPVERFAYPSLGPRLSVGGTLSLRGGLRRGASVAAAWLFRQERTADGARRLSGRPQLAFCLGVGHAF